MVGTTGTLELLESALASDPVNEAKRWNVWNGWNRFVAKVEKGNKKNSHRNVYVSLTGLLMATRRHQFGMISHSSS
jgi:hypothetical protein